MQKKIAVINDLSGYGRCSLTVAIPVLSAMGHQCCPVPTAILSSHTEFPVYFFDDYTEKMTPYTDKWKELGLSFDAIATGFLGSEAQIEIVMDIIRKLDAEKSSLPEFDSSEESAGAVYKSRAGKPTVLTVG